jgi:archaellum component FlaC
LTGLFSEKYLKKLIGRTEVEDALKRLDKLTQEEARMATAQVLKAMHTVDDRVREVSDKVIGVDDRVAGVGDRVASVDDRVKAVDDKVAVVINGAQYIFNQSFKKQLTQCS